MNDITGKVSTLRRALATAVVSVSRPETICSIEEQKVPKGDVFEMAKAAGLLAVKKTSDLIPDCHPLPIEAAVFRFQISGQEIHIFLEVKTTYKTGVEVEAMHGASVAALTMYDMLKPIDRQVEIRSIRLLEKNGGKSDVSSYSPENLRAAVIVCSDTTAAGKRDDVSGKTIISKLNENKIHVADYCIIPDEKELIREKAEQYCNAGYDLVIYTGGTGVSPRDVTPDVLRPWLDRELPGLMEAARSYGQQRTPYAMLSRGIAGLKGKTLFLALPGSARAAEESMQALFPHVLHVFRVIGGDGHA